MPAALELKNVTKRFGDKLAVDDLSLTIGEGEFVGLLGRNGAGKSTTIKMATGLLDVTSGSITVLGLDIATKSLEARRLMGVMPEDMALLELLTGPQYLRFVGRMYGLEEDVIDTRAKELFDTLDLNPGHRTLVTDYSFGMKKKLALCSALLHAPKLVLLDEPFEGIDAITNRTIKDILLSLQQKGVTLVLTSHILEVVERLCPRIAIIDEGKLKGFGALEQLKGASDTLESHFVGLVGGGKKGELSWL